MQDFRVCGKVGENALTLKTLRHIGGGKLLLVRVFLDAP